MSKQYIRALGNGGAHHEECRRGDIAGHVDIAGGQLAAGRDRDDLTLARHRMPKTRQHALGMITRRGRLPDRGPAFGVETGEQQAGFHLGAGHGHLIVNTLER